MRNSKVHLINNFKQDVIRDKFVIISLLSLAFVCLGLALISFYKTPKVTNNDVALSMLSKSFKHKNLFNDFNLKDMNDAQRTQTNPNIKKWGCYLLLLKFVSGVKIDINVMYHELIERNLLSETAYIRNVQEILDFYKSNLIVSSTPMHTDIYIVKLTKNNLSHFILLYDKGSVKVTLYDSLMDEYSNYLGRGWIVKRQTKLYLKDTKGYFKNNYPMYSWVILGLSFLLFLVVLFHIIFNFIFWIRR